MVLSEISILDAPGSMTPQFSLEPQTLSADAVPQARIVWEHCAIEDPSGLLDRMGLEWSLYSADGNLLGQTPRAFPIWLTAAVRRSLGTHRDPKIIEVSEEFSFILAGATAPDGTLGTAVAYLPESRGRCPAELVVAAGNLGWSQAEFDRWYQSLPRCEASVLRTLLTGPVTISRDQLIEKHQNEIDKLAGELEQTYEEISLLHSLNQHMLLSRSPRDLGELCLDRLMDVIPAEGVAIWLEGGSESEQLQVRGEFPLREEQFARLVARFDDHDWSRPFVRNRIAGSLLGADFPGLRNVVISAIAVGKSRYGWICCCNSTHDEFGSVQVRLLSSVASVLSAHSCNVDLYRQHQQLVISFVSSLVRSLDAKDPYTRGHSERVAMIARRLGEEMNLPAEDLKDIYLSGLVHDIGKIGVDDAILRKPGRLTEEEMAHIQRHPEIGYNILSGLKNLKSILPGVRFHHESYSGKGYPIGLKGEAIPLMARIIAVADSYDAMGSDRPYRQGMPIEKVSEILERGAGDQWDPAVIAAFFAAREDIQKICREHSGSADPLAPISNGTFASTVEE